MKIATVGGARNIRELSGLFQKNVEIAFVIDNNMHLDGRQIEGKVVYSPYNFPRNNVDYIVVFLYEYEAVYQELLDLGVDSSRIINFMNLNLDLYEYQNIFHIDVADTLRLKIRMDFTDKKIKTLEDSQRNFERNYVYEALDKFRNNDIKIPKVKSVQDTYSRIISDRCSISRYGDGEFEIILGNAKDIYQSDNTKLAGRLRDILISNLPNHIVAIADDYGAMEGLREENKNTIRGYMTKEKREKHYALLDMEKEYYNAYISRPYVIYPHDDIKAAGKRFDELKKIWEKQRVLFIEGDRTRMGVGNDLFSNAGSIERIIAPNEDAFDVYEGIYKAALTYGKDRLILIALGPTATVLAYDLAKAGYWALDIGHLDLEYEWYLKGRGYSYIPHKYNNEMLGDTHVTEVTQPNYAASILCSIGKQV